MTLFKDGYFTAHSGVTLPWKIECDTLTDEDWAWAAQVAANNIGPFLKVEGVPRGGLKFAEALRKHAVDYQGATPLVIVDDVLTTGDSMNRHRGSLPAIGVVLFARGICPDWITPIWTMPHLVKKS